MLFRRHFTVMVVPDAQALLKRFQVRGGQIAGGILGLAVLIAFALSAPLFLLWGIHQTRELAQVREDRDHLVMRASELEKGMAELRQRVAKAEQKETQLSAAMGISAAPARKTGGSGNIVEFPPTPAQRVDQLRAEADALGTRLAFLDRRLDRAEQDVGTRAEEYIRKPLIPPAHGLIGAAFGWRRDPFTGEQQFHRGVDICAPVGTPVVAPADGVVLSTTRDGGYGNVLTLGHGNGVSTRYGHLSAFKVKVGEKVHRGEVIALIGNTGRSTGAHVHYEVLDHGASVNPEDGYMSVEELD